MFFFRCLQNLGIYPHYSAIIQQNFFPEQQLRRLNKDMIAIHYQSPRDMHKLEKFFYGKREVGLFAVTVIFPSGKQEIFFFRIN